MTHPERIASVSVGTGGAAVPLQLCEPLASWVLDPDLDKYRRMDPRTIINAGWRPDTVSPIPTDAGLSGPAAHPVPAELIVDIQGKDS